jgi:zinc transport system substrate-binding protein
MRRRLLLVSGVHGKVLLLVATVLLLAACAPPEQQAAQKSDGVLAVATVNYPLAYFAERIGGEHVKVSFAVPADVDPAFWQPSPEAILKFQQADLILINGAGYAAWLKKAALPLSRIIDTSAVAKDQLIIETEGVRHKHGPTGEHDHGETAFTTWLDPAIAQLQAAAILQALAQARPEYAEVFDVGYRQLVDDLDALNVQFAGALALPANATVVFSHPVYQYLQRHYAINAKTVLWEPDMALTSDDLSSLPARSDAPGLQLVIWEAEPSAANRAALAAAGYQSVVFVTAANKPAEGDYLDAMRANAKRFEELPR